MAGLCCAKLPTVRGRSLKSPTVPAIGEDACDSCQDRLDVEERYPDVCGLLDEVEAYIERFVAYPSEHARVAHALWTMHTHCMDHWDSTPRIAFLSPEPGSGKTRALEITETLVPRPIEAINVTPAYLFRRVSSPDGRPTVLYDEIDTVFGPKAKDNEDIRGFLNAGHRRGAMVGRCVTHGSTITTEDFPAYCAVGIAGLGDLPDTVLSRSIVIRMRRRSQHETVEPYRRRIHAPQGYALRDRLAGWSESFQLDNGFPDTPSGVEDRDADVWESMLAVADAIGGSWPERARVAAVALVAQAKDDTPSLGVQLLADLRTVFADAGQLATDEILQDLHGMEESPWSDLRGKSLDARRLARMLRTYGAKSKSIRIGTRTRRGYAREDLCDAWDRYLPKMPDKGATSATTETVDVYNDGGDEEQVLV